MNLTTLIEKEFRLKDTQKKALKRLGLKTLQDLLFHFPSRYESFAERKNIIDLAEGDKTTVYGRVIEIKTNKSFRRNMAFSTVIIGDFTGTIKAVWFHQPYITRSLIVGDKVSLTGKIARRETGLYIANPSCEKVDSYENLGGRENFLAVYPETRGITSRWIRYTIKKILAEAEEFPADPIPNEIIKKYHLPTLKSAIVFIHSPQKEGDAEAAKKRFAFEEIFFIQLARLYQRAQVNKKNSPIIAIDRKKLNEFLAVFPFQLTSAQKKTIEHIVQDFSNNKPMSRLLEGDVGSGKTAVAVVSAYLATMSGYQVAYMAPTEILAQQHFKSFINYFSQLNLNAKIGLITSSECQKFPSKVSFENSTRISKSQLLEWVERGEIPILIGTHSLIQKSVKFKKLALVIIDEQHRFGVKQRAELVNRGENTNEFIPHLLSMTATPIPRTLALTIYSDLDLSLLDEMPAGRRKIITEIVDPKDRPKAYEKIRTELKAGRQAYVICPRIEEPDPEKQNILNLKAVVEEADRLRKEVFSEFEIDILHGKMLPKEKEGALNNFRDNKTQILVATSVIEVGIDIPNATSIIIEGAERFGLAQLHQLRGRVMRSNYQPYCYVFTSEHTKSRHERLTALEKAKNGFELAEYDLKFRGSGELSGGKQWGVSDMGMDALKNMKMVEAARIESQKIIEADQDLKKHPLIALRLKQKDKVHFE